MPDRLMLVPGTGGVRFKFSDGTKAPYVVEMLEEHFLGDDETFYQSLGCAHDAPKPQPDGCGFGPRLSTLEPGKTLVPGPILEGTAYQTVLDFGVDQKDPKKYFPCAYDWRLDIRYNAKLLLDLLKAAASRTRWNLLCHSQGGLVVIAASLLAGADLWAKIVRNVSFVAIPFVGTARSIQAIIEGTNFGKGTSEVFRRTARTWPALYQMFPGYFCVVNEPSALILDPTFWSLLGVDGQALVTRARSFWQTIDYHPFRAMDPNSVAFFLARSDAPNTPVYVTADRAALPSLTPDLDLADTLVPWTPPKGFLTCSSLGSGRL